MAIEEKSFITRKHSLTMYSHIPDQAVFFYRGKWSQEMDTLMLSTMIMMRKNEGWNGASVPVEVIRKVRDLINDQFGVSLVCEDLSVRLEFLEARYKTFKAVVATNGVQWIREDKVVIADEDTWKIIFQRDASAGAYYHRDEADFNTLATMFGLSDVKEEEVSHEVITLSDNTEVIVITDTVVLDEPNLGKPIASPADPDEVTSPMPGPATRVRRKLFDVSDQCPDELSSNKSPARFMPLMKQLYSSPKGSSCASWSPSPTSRKTAP